MGKVTEAGSASGPTERPPSAAKPVSVASHDPQTCHAVIDALESERRQLRAALKDLAQVVLLYVDMRGPINGESRAVMGKRAEKALDMIESHA